MSGFEIKLSEQSKETEEFWGICVVKYLKTVMMDFIKK